MAIQENLNEAIKEAMRAKDKTTLQTLRILSAALKQIQIDQQITITEEIALAEFTRQVKLRQEAARQYHATGREDLAEKEETEILIIQKFLPAQMSTEEIHAYVDKAFAESGLAQEPASLSKLMPQLKTQLQGRADLAQVSRYLQQKLKP